MEAVLKQTKRIEITEENPEVLICVYGTLRLGRNNYKAFLEHKSEYLGTFRTDANYTMYGKNDHFPIVIDNGKGSIECDVFKITSNTVLNRVHRLEGCTGIPGDSDNWYDIIAVDTPYGKGYMYVMHNDDAFERKNIIKSGNWNNKH